MLYFMFIFINEFEYEESLYHTEQEHIRGVTDCTSQELLYIYYVYIYTLYILKTNDK